MSKPVLTKLNLIHLNYVCPLPRGGFSAAVQRQNKKNVPGLGGNRDHTFADWNKLEASTLSEGYLSPVEGARNS